MVKLQLYAIGQQAVTELQSELIDTTNEVLSKAISDLRNISHNLHGGYVSRNGLQEAVEKEVNYINGSRSVNANLITNGAVYSLESERELLIFRIVQEAINNGLKHANAETIEVSLNYLPDSFTVMIRDDGDGFDNTLSKQSKGLGLSNMKNRAALLNGELYIESTIPRGTIITLTVKTKTNDQSEDKNSVS
jgi:signal transduction histidine kinase